VQSSQVMSLAIRKGCCKMEEEFMTDDKESRLKSLRERMMLWLLINLVRKRMRIRSTGGRKDLRNSMLHS